MDWIGQTICYISSTKLRKNGDSMDYLKVLMELYLKQNGIDAEVITKPIEEETNIQQKEETA